MFNTQTLQKMEKYEQESPLQLLFPEWFTGGGSLAPVNGFLHPGYCCLNPPSGQKGTSVQKCFDTSLANI